MKFACILLCLFSTTGFCQNSSPSPTTEEEYNYMTKGFKVQIESGLDMKKGYSFSESEKVTVGNYSFELKPLMRDAKKEIAGVMIVSKSSVSGRTYYLAIPIGNKELMDKYYADLNSFDEPMTTAYAYVLSAYFAVVMNAANELEKKTK